jgi:hypothetical protein
LSEPDRVSSIFNEPQGSSTGHEAKVIREGNRENGEKTLTLSVIPIANSPIQARASRMTYEQRPLIWRRAEIGGSIERQREFRVARAKTALDPTRTHWTHAGVPAHCERFLS